MTTAPDGDRCPRCSALLVTISFRQGRSDMTMASCATCHRRTWLRDNRAVELDEVLTTIFQGRRQR